MKNLRFESPNDALVYFRGKFPVLMTNDELLYLCGHADIFMNASTDYEERTFWYNMKGAAFEVLKTRGVKPKDLDEAMIDLLSLLPEELLGTVESCNEKIAKRTKRLAEMITQEKARRSAGKKPKKTPRNNLDEKSTDELLEMLSAAMSTNNFTLTDFIKNELKNRKL